MRATKRVGSGLRRARLAAVAGVAVVALAACMPRVDVLYLSDHTGGRDNGTHGSYLARSWIAGQLHNMGAVPIAPDNPRFRQFDQPIPDGTNLLAIIPGTDLADEYVVVGAHHDAVGNCGTEDPADRLCNGATDNATGVAAVLEIGRRLTADGGAPRRSVVLALWDREEDSLLGSQYYVQHPVVPLADTVAYVNFDILGANLLPSLRSTTFAIGAESGGAALAGAVADAAAASDLDVAHVSAIFGQYRSDYIHFLGARVPSIFFSDSTGRCYHTAQDDSSVVDFRKLDEQIDLAEDVTRTLADSDDPPSFVSGAPAATFADLLAILDVVQRSSVDADLFSAADQATTETIRTGLEAIAADGEAAFDDADLGFLLQAASAAVTILTHGECDGFLAP